MLQDTRKTPAQRTDARKESPAIRAAMRHAPVHDVAPGRTPGLPAATPSRRGNRFARFFAYVFGDRIRMRKLSRLKMPV